MDERIEREMNWQPEDIKIKVEKFDWSWFLSKLGRISRKIGKNGFSQFAKVDYQFEILVTSDILSIPSKRSLPISTHSMSTKRMRLSDCLTSYFTEPELQKNFKSENFTKLETIFSNHNFNFETFNNLSLTSSSLSTTTDPELTELPKTRPILIDFESFINGLESQNLDFYSTVHQTLNTLANYFRSFKWQEETRLKLAFCNYIKNEFLPSLSKITTLDEAFIIMLYLELSNSSASNMLETYLILESGSISDITFQELTLRYAFLKVDSLIKNQKQTDAYQTANFYLNLITDRVKGTRNNEYFIGPISKLYSIEALEAKIQTLKQLQCLDDIDELYEAENFERVINLLQPILETNNPFLSNDYL